MKDVFYSPTIKVPPLTELFQYNQKEMIWFSPIFRAKDEQQIICIWKIKIRVK